MTNETKIKNRPFNKHITNAIEKWPNVPECYGWLKLNRRGEWLLKNKKVRHKRTIAFLNENYRVGEDGSSYVQNGPQQVFVALEYTPWVYRFNHHTGFSTHNHLKVRKINRAMSDEHGNLLIETSYGVGLVDDRDLGSLSAFLTETITGSDVLEHTGARVPIIKLTEHQITRNYAFQKEPLPTNERHD